MRSDLDSAYTVVLTSWERLWSAGLRWLGRMYCASLKRLKIIPRSIDPWTGQAARTRRLPFLFYNLVAFYYCLHRRFHLQEYRLCNLSKHAAFFSLKTVDHQRFVNSAHFHYDKDADRYYKNDWVFNPVWTRKVSREKVKGGWRAACLFINVVKSFLFLRWATMGKGSTVCESNEGWRQGQ